MNKRTLEHSAESAAVGYFQLDKDGKYTYVNKRYIKMFGYGSESQLIGTSFINIIPESEKSEKRKRYNTLKQILDSSVVKSTIFKRRQNGTTKYHSFIANPIYNEKSKPIGAEGFIIDITDQIESK